MSESMKEIKSNLQRLKNTFDYFRETDEGFHLKKEWVCANMFWNEIQEKRKVLGVRGGS